MSANEGALARLGASVVNARTQKRNFRQDIPTELLHMIRVLGGHLSMIRELALVFFRGDSPEFLRGE
jgi:hypothetical protein